MRGETLRNLAKMQFQLDKIFNMVLKLGAPLLVLIIALRLMFETSQLFYLVDIGMLIIISTIHLMRKKIEFDLKLNLICTTMLGHGVISYIYFGHTASGIAVLSMAFIITAIFASKRAFVMLNIPTLIAIVAIALTKHYTIGTDQVYMLFMITVTIAIVRLSVGNLKQTLTENIIELDFNLKENELMYKELVDRHDELQSSKREIYNLAYYDQLTGLSNKNHFKNYVNHRIKDVSSAVMMVVDIKDFKLINTVYGSKMGDRLLCVVADVVEKFKDPLLHIGRVSGDEFLVWYESDDYILMKSQLDRFILEYNVQVRKIYTYTKLQFHMAYVKYPLDGDNFSDLFNKVNIALEYAKNLNDRSIIQYCDDMSVELEKEAHLKEHIEEAVANRAYHVHYQEKFDIMTECVNGLEALARWDSDVLGSVEPNIFIPMIRKYQLTSSFERLIIGKVFADYPHIIDKYGKINISINISPEHLLTKGFAKYFSDAMALYRVKPEDITIELTEDIIRVDMSEIEPVLAALKKVGIRISLDNFGTNYTVLKRIHELPFDEIKVDRCFIKDIQDFRTQSIFSTFIAIRDSFDLNIVAEGVETTEQLEILKKLGCTKMQGFLYSKPTSLENLRTEEMQKYDIL